METNTLLNVVIAYEDYEAGTRARNIMERLAPQLGREFQVMTDGWKFEMIGNCRLMPHAVQAAAGADLIILAMSENDDLPSYVKQWFEEWTLFKRAEPVALVVLHHLRAYAGESPALRTYLESVVNQRGIDLFWYGDDRSMPNVMNPVNSAELALAQ
jgi:hypothetical protein